MRVPDISDLTPSIIDLFNEQNCKCPIYCPHCKATQSREMMLEHTTYFGEVFDPADEIAECVCCGEKFRIIEYVDRTFKTIECEL